VVYNHAGYGSRYTTDPRTRGWLRSEQAGTCGDDDLTSCVGGLPDFRTELPEVAEYLYEAHLGLAQRVGLDGFRLDTVKHVSHEFWQEHRRRADAALGKGFFLLGEVWGGDPDVLDPYFETDELDAGFDFSFQGNALSWVQGRGRTIAFNRFLERRHRTREGHHLAHYLSSHDVPTAPFQLDGDWQGYRLAVALQLTSVGIPVLYYGEEVGRLGGDWPDNRSDMPWGDLGVGPGAGIPRDEALRDHVARLVDIRREHPALSRGAYRAISNDGDLLVFARTDAASGDEVVVAVNRGDEAAAFSTDLPVAWKGRRVYDDLQGSEIDIEGSQLRAEVGPRTAKVIVAR
jgi:alpha-amylase